MSDWGGTPSWECALNGLDQECGAQIDAILWQAEAFTEPLRAAYADGRLPGPRLSEMVRRILRSLFAVGVDRWEPAPPPDMAGHNGIALDVARQGTVLLQNRGVLPLAPESGRRVAVIGGYAQIGVPTGFGSSAVVPPGGYASVIPIGAPGLGGSAATGRNLYLLPSSPLEELRKRLPHVEFDPGISPAEAALAARRADVVIVFGIRVEGEGLDGADLSLPWGQDAMISAVAEANSNTVVVLETGNPVGMPWRDSVNAILQAWYPGQAGGQAIAEIIVGETNPSARLPVTFPVDLAQTPRPELPGLGAAWAMPTTIHYSEGSDVGYRWFAKTGSTPMFAFGHGLSYTSFELPRLDGSRRRHHQCRLYGGQHRRPRGRRRSAAVLDRRSRRAATAVAGLSACRARARRILPRQHRGRSAPAGPLRRPHRQLANQTAASTRWR